MVTSNTGIMKRRRHIELKIFLYRGCKFLVDVDKPALLVWLNEWANRGKSQVRCPWEETPRKLSTLPKTAAGYAPIRWIASLQAFKRGGFVGE